MRIVRFAREGKAALGILNRDKVVDLTSLRSGAPTDIGEVLEAYGSQGLDALAAAAASAPASATRAVDGLTFLPPVSRPGKIVCLGLNYVDHAAEGGHAKPTYPSFFYRGSSSLIGHRAPIVRPPCSTQLDYECELVAIVGRKARHVKQADALAYIAGYSCFNDATIRDYQRKTGQWTIGKNFDGTGAFGPWFVSADELPPGANGLKISTRLNGQTMQSAVTSDMLFPVAETIAILTECMTLEPGDLIVMGTPAGVGYARKPPVWMKAGDVVEVDIENIGVLSNPIADEA